MYAEINNIVKYMNIPVIFSKGAKLEVLPNSIAIIWYGIFITIQWIMNISKQYGESLENMGLSSILYKRVLLSIQAIIINIKQTMGTNPKMLLYGSE